MKMFCTMETNCGIIPKTIMGIRFTKEKIWKITKFYKTLIHNGKKYGNKPN